MSHSLSRSLKHKSGLSKLYGILSFFATAVSLSCLATVSGCTFHIGGCSLLVPQQETKESLPKHGQQEKKITAVGA
jgi:hypothetical protein